jgi:hypothetical protein
MSWNYNSMAKLATFVASGVEEYDRQDVESMVETCGWEVADDFYERYERLYDIDCSQQREWINELAEQED